MCAASNNPPPLQSLALEGLENFFAAADLSAHQARLVFQALHKHGELDPEKMPALSASCLRFLRSLPPQPSLTLQAVHRARDGTIKLRLAAGRQAVEVVLIPGPRRLTVCLSCQIGCAAGCAFCRTGVPGLRRNLAAWEMVEQARVARRFWQEEGGALPLANLVFMGMGEPLHNEANVLQACHILSHDLGAGFSKRHIVVSTAGVGDRIRPFWEQNAAALSLSLHATTDEVRNELIPLNRRWNLAALHRILLDIPWRHRETVTIAYLLLEGVNDTRADARRLAAWCRPLPAKINLVEFNAFPGARFRHAGEAQVAAFREWLREEDAFHTLRQSRGGDVLAACGQLAAGRD